MQNEASKLVEQDSADRATNFWKVTMFATHTYITKKREVSTLQTRLMSHEDNFISEKNTG